MRWKFTNMSQRTVVPTRCPRTINWSMQTDSILLRKGEEKNDLRRWHSLQFKWYLLLAPHLCWCQSEPLEVELTKITKFPTSPFHILNLKTHINPGSDWPLKLCLFPPHPPSFSFNSPSTPERLNSPADLGSLFSQNVYVWTFPHIPLQNISLLGPFTCLPGNKTWHTVFYCES